MKINHGNKDRDFVSSHHPFFFCKFRHPKFGVRGYLITSYQCIGGTYVKLFVSSLSFEKMFKSNS